MGVLVSDPDILERGLHVMPFYETGGCAVIVVVDRRGVRLVEIRTTMETDHDIILPALWDLLNQVDPEPSRTLTASTNPRPKASRRKRRPPLQVVQGGAA